MEDLLVSYIHFILIPKDLSLSHFFKCQILFVVFVFHTQKTTSKLLVADGLQNFTRAMMNAGVPLSPPCSNLILSQDVIKENLSGNITA